MEHQEHCAVALHYREVAPQHIGEVGSASAHRIGAQAGLRVTSGRKVVELRPDLDWDKGAALAWIRDGSIGRAPAADLVSDDLTDEDAFDAVRFDGIGMVVRALRGRRPQTAAQFTLQSPDQVREFIQRGAQRLAYKQEMSGEAWNMASKATIRRTRSFVRRCARRQRLFATRGAAPESQAGEVHYPGTYAAGVYNRLADDVVGDERSTTRAWSTCRTGCR